MRCPLNWQAAYAAYKDSGLNVRAFCLKHLLKFCDSWVPCYETVLKHFKLLAQQEAAEKSQPKPIIRTFPENQDLPIIKESTATQPTLHKPSLTVAVFSEDDVKRAMSTLSEEQGCAVRTPPDCRVPRLFRMRLPNGTSVEFESHQAEQLALQMALLCRGAA